MRKLLAAPAVVLTNPKYKHNVGGVLRACSCFAVPTMIWTGDRVVIDKDLGERLPREERMKGYRDVTWTRSDRPFVLIEAGVVPVAVEIFESSEPLTYFEHPDRAVYIFGPEDGSINQMWRRHCHRFVHIPAHHCLNLASAVSVVLADRMMKRQLSGAQLVVPIGEMLREHRGFAETSAMDQLGWDGK
jgi:tRNA(Leu) C34 or U34 (ribose-2'-O)-methylase TrmL